MVNPVVLILALAPLASSLGSALDLDSIREDPVSRSTVAAYDPLQFDKEFVPKVIDLVVAREIRPGWFRKKEREVPIRVYLPSEKEPAPVVLFSHGLGGARTGSSFLGKRWAARGYVAVFLQHPGSDEALWKGKSKINALVAMRLAASWKNTKLRAEDVGAVLDQLALWNASKTHELAQCLNLERIGMSGHSFGALTTQAASGMASGLFRPPLGDKRIRAALCMSPSSSRFGEPKSAFEEVEIPWMLMTGTLDEAPVGGQTVESRREVFGALPLTNPRFELVLDGAEHSAFTERALPGDQAPRNPNHHRVILALSTAFWDAYLSEDKRALEWLVGAAPRGVMESKDLWQIGLVMSGQASPDEDQMLDGPK